MKAIYKYVLDKPDQVIELPMGSKVLSAKNVNNKVVVYVLVPKCEKTLNINYHFKVLLTGESITMGNYKFLDTVTLNEFGSVFVYHVFHKGE